MEALQAMLINKTMPKEKLTKKQEIEIICDTLKSALIRECELDEKETKMKLEKINAHNATVMAKQAISSLRIE